MKLSFLISAHTDAPHLRHLIESLPEGSEFFVHIDAKSDITPFIKELSRPDVHFISHRVNVVWGSINEVEYQMEMVREALRCSPDYLITLSGMDYPVWSNKKIMDYFHSLNGCNVLQGLRITLSDPKNVNYREFRLLSTRQWRKGSMGSKFRVAMRKTASMLGIKKALSIKARGKHYDLYKGAAWWAITPQLAVKALYEWDENKKLRRYFSTSFCPAETFLQTVAFNSSFSDTCILTEGQFTTLQALTPLTFIDYSNGVLILNANDYDRIVASGKMFCRKTITGESDALMDMIDKKRKENF